mmetsp:Transcript_52638/g.112622  ORF Transcript_52638/g.112622 Transcript_52638/m.112622 type:complete len:228 (+) Transcript_52638:156-839(+)
MNRIIGAKAPHACSICECKEASNESVSLWGSVPCACLPVCVPTPSRREGLWDGAIMCDAARRVHAPLREELGASWRCWQSCRREERPKAGYRCRKSGGSRREVHGDCISSDDSALGLIASRSSAAVTLRPLALWVCLEVLVVVVVGVGEADEIWRLELRVRREGVLVHEDSAQPVGGVLIPDDEVVPLAREQVVRAMSVVAQVHDGATAHVHVPVLELSLLAASGAT